MLKTGQNFLINIFNQQYVAVLGCNKISRKDGIGKTKTSFMENLKGEPGSNRCVEDASVMHLHKVQGEEFSRVQVCLA